MREPYTLVDRNNIVIGFQNIFFPKETEIQKIELMKNGICFNIAPKEDDLDWDFIETHEIWKSRCFNNPSQLFFYSYTGQLIWTFMDVVGFGLYPISVLNKSNFITEEAYENFMNKYKFYELIEVYAGDYCYILDADTGNIESKMYSK